MLNYLKFQNLFGTFDEDYSISNLPTKNEQKIKTKQ